MLAGSLSVATRGKESAIVRSWCDAGAVCAEHARGPEETKDVVPSASMIHVCPSKFTVPVKPWAVWTKKAVPMRPSAANTSARTEPLPAGTALRTCISMPPTWTDSGMIPFAAKI